MLQDQYTKPTQQFKGTLNQYPVLPPISANNTYTETSDRRSVTDSRQQQLPTDQEVPSNETIPPLNINDDRDHYEQQQYQQPQPPYQPPQPPYQQSQPSYQQQPPYQQSQPSYQQQPQQPMISNEDTYLPEESVLLTDYEEEHLAEKIRTQLGELPAIDRLKLLYQELTAYDPNATGYAHYSNIRSLTYKLGVK